MWFEKLMGFEEISPENVQKNIFLEGEFIHSKLNGKKYRFGILEVPTLEELRNRISLQDFDGSIRIEEVVGNVAEYHQNPQNKNAVFQAASQFNLLEMVSPQITPERGVDIYENDRTQGPACAVSCGAGTIYRNYFVEVNGKTGQSSNNQIDCLENFAKEFNNETLDLWKMQNGYALFSTEGLKFLQAKLAQLSSDELDVLQGKLKVGIQWNTEVTTANSDQIVTQVYCSALPIGYHSVVEKAHFEHFAKLILEATYEATFYAATENFLKTGCPKLYLTLVGGGVFGNSLKWILEAVSKAIKKFRNVPLEVYIISYGNSNEEVAKFVKNHS